MSAPSTVVREIERRNAGGGPVVLFVHPWEIDEDPPRVRLPAGHRFAHYFRLHGYRDRLERILRSVPFGPLSDVLDCMPELHVQRDGGTGIAAVTSA
jgi:hypothetical protein